MMILLKIYLTFLSSVREQDEAFLIVALCLAACIGGLIMAEINRTRTSSIPTNSWKRERERYFKNAEWFDLTYEQTLENFKDIKTLTDLISINNKVEKIIDSYKKQDVSV